MGATTHSDAFDLLMEVLERGLARNQSTEPHLPPGRCACHEPTVKWCTRHGEPRRYSTPMRTATATAQGANAAETTSNAPSSSS
jgi:hypothetical protein